VVHVKKLELEVKRGDKMEWQEIVLLRMLVIFNSISLLIIIYVPIQCEFARASMGNTLGRKR
jgi:hypothetical protein